MYNSPTLMIVVLSIVFDLIKELIVYTAFFLFLRKLINMSVSKMGMIIPLVLQYPDPYHLIYFCVKCSQFFPIPQIFR